LKKGCRAGLLLAAKSYWLWDSNFLSGGESLRRTDALTIPQSLLYRADRVISEEAQWQNQTRDL
jgi:hypothetical protein